LLAHAVADDGCHVAVLDHIRLIADPAVARNDPSAALLIELGDRDVDDMVQDVQHPLHRAALRAVEARI
jgi:hypothetical protein